MSVLNNLIRVVTTALLCATTIDGATQAATVSDAAPKPRPEGIATQTAAPAIQRGPVTSLPMPRYVSTKSVEVNVRRGPSLTHRIDWVFRRRGMPLEIVGEYGHWRRVRDRDGAGGWVHYSLLSGIRTVIVDQDMLVMHRAADPDSEPMAIAEAGVIARLGKCKALWCRITADGHKGWVEKTTLWGVGTDELRD